MEDCLLVWIGSPANKSFTNLTLSTESRYESPIISTMILGTLTDIHSQAIGKKLVQKLKKQVYVSYNLDNDRWLPEVEKRLFEEIAKVPNAFNEAITPYNSEKKNIYSKGH